MLSGPVIVSTGLLVSVALTCTVEAPGGRGRPTHHAACRQAKAGRQRAAYLAAGIGRRPAGHPNGGAVRYADRRAGEGRQGQRKRSGIDRQGNRTRHGLDRAAGIRRFDGYDRSPGAVGVPVTGQAAPRVSPAGNVPAVITQL